MTLIVFILFFVIVLFFIYTQFVFNISSLCSSAVFVLICHDEKHFSMHMCSVGMCTCLNLNKVH